MRYFFDIKDGGRFAHDDIGTDLRSDNSARVQATIALTEMARDYLPGDGPDRQFAIRVRRSHHEMFTLTLDFATHDKLAQTDDRPARPSNVHG